MTIETAWPIAGVLVAVGAVYFAQARLVRRFRGHLESADRVVGDGAGRSLYRHLLLWMILGGFSLVLPVIPIPENLRTLAYRATGVVFLASLTLISMRLACGIVRGYANRLAFSNNSVSLAEKLTRVGIALLGALLILSNLGISVMPVLTALGVGSLAVALALQDTLGNLFAGIHIIASHIVEEGDYIKLDSGQEGYVVDVGWRSTHIRELPNNIVIVPNSKLAQAIVVNYHQPDKELAALVSFGVSYASDLSLVEQVTVDVARQVMREVPGGVPQFEPFVRFNAFAESAVTLTVIMRAKEFTDRFLIIHEFIKRLHQRYKKEGIVVPFPQRTLHVHRLREQGQASARGA